MEYLPRSSYSVLLCWEPFTALSLSLKLGLPKLQEERDSVTEGGEHTWEENVTFCCEVPMYTIPYSSAGCKLNME